MTNLPANLDMGTMDDDYGVNTYMQDFQTFFQSMVEDWNVKLIGSGFIAFCAEIFGQDWWLIQCLFALIFADCALGMISAKMHNGCLSSRRLHDGIVKIMAYCLSIILVWLVQEIAIRSLPVQLPVMALYAGYQSLTEIKSISRHLERLGFAMPALFHKVANGVNDKLDKAVEDVLPDTNKNNHEESRGE